VDITPATAVAMKQFKAQSDLAVGVLRKVLDTSSQQGADLAKMVDQAGGVGQRIDLYA
jgi:hypothetical protein